MKPKKCRQCKTVFTPRIALQVVCSPSCAIAYAKVSREKKERLESRLNRKEAKEKLKSRKDWQREAQIAFNSWIRARDIGKPCISCGSHTGKQNAGHYRSVGSSPELRFNPQNCHLQCEKCNSYLSGNLINYRIELIKRIGIELVEWTEGYHAPKHYSVDDLKAIKAEYVLKLKELRKNTPDSNN